MSAYGPRASGPEGQSLRLGVRNLVSAFRLVIMDSPSSKLSEPVVAIGCAGFVALKVGLQTRSFAERLEPPLVVAVPGAVPSIQTVRLTFLGGQTPLRGHACQDFGV